MAATEWDGPTFEAHRPLLFSIAYRMLGSASEAEDVLQDAWLRARQDEYADVRSPRAYLTTIVTRLCIDHLRSAERTRMVYPGPWLPEPLAEPNQESAEFASSLTTAFLVLLEQLAPAERAVFLLREVFELDFDEIARSVGKSEANTRQILTRARSRLREARPRFTVSRGESEEIVQRFRHACVTGNVEELMAVLHADATFIADGGGKAAAPTSPVLGADRIAAFLVDMPARRAGRSRTSSSSRSTARPACSCAIRSPATAPTRSTSPTAAFARSMSCATPTSCVGSSSTRIEHAWDGDQWSDFSLTDQLERSDCAAERFVQINRCARPTTSDVDGVHADNGRQQRAEKDDAARRAREREALQCREGERHQQHGHHVHGHERLQIVCSNVSRGERQFLIAEEEHFHHQSGDGRTARHVLERQAWHHHHGVPGEEQSQSRDDQRQQARALDAGEIRTFVARPRQVECPICAGFRRHPHGVAERGQHGRQHPRLNRQSVDGHGGQRGGARWIDTADIDHDQRQPESHGRRDGDAVRRAARQALQGEEESRLRCRIACHEMSGAPHERATDRAGPAAFSDRRRGQPPTVPRARGRGDHDGEDERERATTASW